MMILKILKKFEEGVLVAKENEIKNQWQFMADYNDLLLRLKQKKEANGKNGEYYSNLTEAQLNTSPSK